MLFRRALLRLAGLPGVEPTIRSSRLTSGVVRRFVAGEAADDAVATARGLAADGIRTTLNYLGEDVVDTAGAEHATGEYLRLLALLDHSDADVNVSVKLTQLGLGFDRSVAAANLERIVTRAAQRDRFIRVDMESSAYTQVTLDLVRTTFERHPNVGVVIQAYLRRSAADIDDLNRRGVRVRLCKGAYREGPDVAFPTAAEVGANYLRLAERLLAEGNRPALATHDPRMIHGALRIIGEQHVPPDRYEWQMLFGVRRDLQRALVNRRYAVRVYVPYGEDWYPYLTRRLAERPANLAFLVGSVLAEARGASGAE